MPKSQIFFITPELQQVLDSVPERNDPRSRLDPFKPYILRWRRQGKTYRRIAEILTKECKVAVSHKGVLKFVKRAARPRKPQLDLEIEPDVQPANSSSAAVPTATRKPRMTPEEQQAARAALRASFDQPLFPTEEQKPLFVRRPGPIRNLNNETLGEKANGSSIDASSGDTEKAGNNR
jgi:hypothetical protein